MFTFSFFLIICILIIFYLSIINRLNYWKNRKIPYVKVSVYEAFRRAYESKISRFEYYLNVYNKLSINKFGGCFDNMEPKFVVCDPDMIKNILIKDFNNFYNRSDVYFNKSDPISMHIFSAPGKLWKDLRINLTPTFTSGKMKYMFNLVCESAEELQRNVKNLLDINDTLDVKALSSAYTVDVINSCAFGIKTNAITNCNSEFLNIIQLLFEIKSKTKLYIWIMEWFPTFGKLLKLRLINQVASDFFFKFVRETVTYRKSTNYIRNDFLQLLIALNENNNQIDQLYDSNGKNNLEMTIELMTSQCFLFFVAGFDTSSFILTLSLLEISLNKNIQKKLQQEIDEYVEENNNEITYNMIKSMSYLNKIVLETMRKYPALATIDRKCTKTYKIPNNDVVIEKGTNVVIPICGIQRDPKYFSNPEEFNPDRFDDKKILLKHFYLPFGEGPRNCIGSRFGLMSVKVGIIYLLKEFNFDIIHETQYPVKFQPMKKVSSCSHKILLKCSKRT